MKKFTGLLLILLVTIAGCQKSGPTTLSEITAHVIDGGTKATDGQNFYVIVDSTRQVVIPINLPADFQQKSINAPVAIKYINTGKTTLSDMGTHVPVVYVVSIRKL